MSERHTYIKGGMPLRTTLDIRVARSKVGGRRRQDILIMDIVPCYKFHFYLLVETCRLIRLKF